MGFRKVNEESLKEVSSENKPLKEKNESETEKKARLEVIEKRKEIEQKINVNQGNRDLI